MQDADDNALAQGSAQLTMPVGKYPVVLIMARTYAVATPSISPPDGSDLSTYGGSVTVTLSCSTAGASMYYTIDGTTPSTSSNLYSGPFVVNIRHPPPQVISAVAVLSGANSAVAVATYTWGW